MSGADTVVLVRHTRKERGDRAAALLATLGWKLHNVYPLDGEAMPDARDQRFAAAVIFGGVPSANDTGPDTSIPAELDWLEDWLTTERPFLGICLGAQMLAKVLGAQVSRHPEGIHEVGFRRLTPCEDCDGFMDEPHHMYQWHKEGFELPAGCTRLVRGDVYPEQAFSAADGVYGVQFHPEVTVGMMSQWLGESGHKLEDLPGAHLAERQHRDAEKFNPRVERWFAGFLDRWIGAAPQS